MDRRSFLSLSFGAAAAPLAPSLRTAPRAQDLPLLVATWPFGKKATDRGLEVLQGGGALLDGVEQGIRAIEAISADGSVGLGGRPNAAGYPQLDACIMDGPTHGAGSVAAVEGIVHPISAARKVMEESKHVMLVGEGARWFALDHGVESIAVDDLPAKKAAWEALAPAERRPKQKKPRGHDTVALVALDADGNLAGGCSTSGAGRKLPGRVGDSPILGSGLYVDNEVGAAGATGLGENIMRHCGCYLVVDLMREGLTPQQACEEAIHRMAQRDPKGYDLATSFIAIDKQGRYGAAGSNRAFPFGVSWPGHSEVARVKRLQPR